MDDASMDDLCMLCMLYKVSFQAGNRVFYGTKSDGYTAYTFTVTVDAPGLLLTHTEHTRDADLKEAVTQAISGMAAKVRRLRGE
jgi:glutamyl/glutaminyl-tRNA synthetase